MLVRLYDLPKSHDLYARVAESEVILRRPGAYEKHLVEDFVREHFSLKWVSEVQVAFSRQPITCFIATKEKEILGFACYETTGKGYFGPTGVAGAARGLALEAQRESGYSYAFIGGVGPKEFYAKTVGAVEIPGSDPGVYVDILPEPPTDS